jgi:hypothetical protein
VWRANLRVQAVEAWKKVEAFFMGKQHAVPLRKSIAMYSIYASEWPRGPQAGVNLFQTPGNAQKVRDYAELMASQSKQKKRKEESKQAQQGDEAAAQCTTMRRQSQ